MIRRSFISGIMTALAFMALCLAAGTAVARDIRIAVAASTPPYVIEQSRSGIEYDVVRESLAHAGYDMQADFVPLARVKLMMQRGQVDGATPLAGNDIDGCYADSHVTYDNYAITRKADRLTITAIRDLQNLDVLSFQNARLYLGDAFGDMAAANRGYRETADQRKQNRALVMGRTQVVIADRFIFAWHMQDQMIRNRGMTLDDIAWHPLFPPGEFHAVFRDDYICQAFNRGLAYLRQSGRYAAIIDTYIPNRHHLPGQDIAPVDKD